MPFKKPHHTSDPNCVFKVGDGYLILPRGLNIVWGNDSRYWKITDQDTAELIQVSWLEVSGVVTINKANTYSIKFHVKVKEDGFGWSGTDVLVMAKIGKKGKYEYKAANLTPGNNILETPLVKKVDEVPMELHFGLYEVWSGKWKGGLEIIKVEVKPTN